MSKITFDKIKIIIISIIMIGIPSMKLLSYILYLTKVINDSFIINQVYVLWISIPILIFTYIYGLIKKKDKISYIDIIIYFLIILAIISTIFALDKNTSIYGEIRRNEGLLTIISYYLLFLNTKSIKIEKNKEILLKIFFSLGLFQVGYSVLQIYSTFGLIKRFSTTYLAMGLCANPNFLGSYMSMLLIASISKYLNTNNNKYLILIPIYNIGLTLAQSTGPFLAIIICIIFMIFYYHKKDKIIKLSIISIILIISFTITNITSKNYQIKHYEAVIKPNYSIVTEIKNIISSDFKEIGNNRIKIWLNLLPKFKDYYLVGAGLDNIRIIYPQNDYFLVDKAHNVYLQIGLTNGVPALLLYLSLCLILFIKGFKLDKNKTIFYFIFIVYSIQAFANISVIDVAPYFFIFLGLLCEEERERNYD